MRHLHKESVMVMLDLGTHVSMYYTRTGNDFETVFSDGNNIEHVTSIALAGENEMKAGEDSILAK